MFAVNLRPFGLHVWPARTAPYRTFVELDTGPLHRREQVLDCTFDKSSAIGIFYSENVDASMMAREEIIIERRSERTDVNKTSGRRSKADADHGGSEMMND